MERRAFLLSAAALPLLAAPNRLTPEEEKQGWRLLFDGKSYAGWINPADKQPAGDSWTIEDGCLKAQAHPKLHEDLITRDTFRDFELRFDWKISPGGNSGVKYRIQRLLFLDNSKLIKGKRFEEQVGYEWAHHLSDRAQVGGNGTGQEYVFGMEYQVIDNAVHKDALRGPLYQAGALYSLVPPKRDAAKPAGEWNESRLVVRGEHAEHWLNGEKVVDTALNAPEIAAGVDKRWSIVPEVRDLLVKQERKDCPLSLQNHGDAAWFRNIRIKRL